MAIGIHDNHSLRQPFTLHSAFTTVRQRYDNDTTTTADRYGSATVWQRQDGKRHGIGSVDVTVNPTIQNGKRRDIQS